MAPGQRGRSWLAALRSATVGPAAAGGRGGRQTALDSWVRVRVTRSRLYLRSRDLLLGTGTRAYWTYREDLARRYLRGTGLEIGALTTPLRLPPGVTARYVDRLPRDELVALEGPGLRRAGIDPERIVDVDHVADGSTLHGIDDDSHDFVVACHVLEHVPDPVAGLENLARVTRDGGTVLIVLPDGRLTFDRRRGLTSTEHVLSDHARGPQWSEREHHLEWARDIEGLDGAAAARRAQEFERSDARHHFHVWDLERFLELLNHLDLPCELVHAQAYAKEFAVVLRVVKVRRAILGTEPFGT